MTAQSPQSPQSPAQKLVGERLQALAPAALRVEDESRRHIGHAEAGAGAHLRVFVVSPRFCGLGALARHRLINQTVGSFAEAGIHALAIGAAQTPEEAAKI